MAYADKSVCACVCVMTGKLNVIFCVIQIKAHPTPLLFL